MSLNIKDGDTVRRTQFRSISAVMAAAFVVTACSESSTGPDPDGEAGQITVNANQVWAYVTFDGGVASVVNVTDPSTSTAWDIAFNGTAVMLNGGAAGPGDVAAYCVCQNRDATDAQVQGFTSENQRAAFEAVGPAQLPAADTAWKSDALALAITGWYRYDVATHTVTAAPGQSFYVRTSGGNAYAKFHVTAIEGATQGTPGRVTFEYAVQPSSGAAMGEAATHTVDVPAGGRVAFDFETDTETETGWDIAFEGYQIRVNGGVSGSGSAAAVALTDPFESLDDASGVPATAYRADAFGGVFNTHRWYRYNLTGQDHQIWPTFDVYLLRKGDAVYKLQLINYYNAAGDARHITFRYAQVGS